MNTHCCRGLILTGLLFHTCAATGREAAPGIELHVAPGGNDTNAGTESKPFATLEQARAAIRAIKKGKGLPVGGVTVTIHGGLYQLARTFELTAEDSGTASAPVVYRARKGEVVTISGGKRVTAWKAVGARLWNAHDLGSGLRFGAGGLVRLGRPGTVGLLVQPPIPPGARDFDTRLALSRSYLDRLRHRLEEPS